MLESVHTRLAARRDRPSRDRPADLPPIVVVGNLTAGGTVTDVDGSIITIEVFIKNEAGDVIAPGVATAELVETRSRDTEGSA